MFLQNFAAQMAGGFDEKAGGAQMGVMQGPMVSGTACSGYILQEECACMCLVYESSMSHNGKASLLTVSELLLKDKW